MSEGLHSTPAPRGKPFRHYRTEHESCLRRLTGSPLSPGEKEAGDTLDGYGVKKFDDGTLYAGDFEGGVRSGYGVQRWPDGHVYIGLWKQGKREGEGEYRFSHGDIDGSGTIEDNECDVYKVTSLALCARQRFPRDSSHALTNSARASG
jgi:hypothetical protein